MSTLAERIVEARHAAGFDKADLQRAVSPQRLTHSALSQIESGKTKSLKAETAIAIARATGFRTEYLVFGHRPRLRSEQPGTQAAEPLPDGIFDAPNRGQLALALEVLEGSLQSTGTTTTAAGKAELLSLIFSLLRVGKTRKAVEKAVARSLRVIGTRGSDPDGGADGRPRGRTATET